MCWFGGPEGKIHCCAKVLLTSHVGALAQASKSYHCDYTVGRNRKQQFTCKGYKLILKGTCEVTEIAHGMITSLRQYSELSVVLDRICCMPAFVVFCT